MDSPVIDELLPKLGVENVELILGTESVGESMDTGDGAIGEVVVKVDQDVDLVLKREDRTAQPSRSRKRACSSCA